MGPRIVALCIVLASVLAAGLPSLVSAKGAPVVEVTIHDEGSAVLANCDGFDVVDTYELNYVLKRFVDENGNLVRIIEHVWGTDTLSNSETGEAYSGSFANNMIIDPAVQMGTNSGIIFRFDSLCAVLA